MQTSGSRRARATRPRIQPRRAHCVDPVARRLGRRHRIGRRAHCGRAAVMLRLARVAGIPPRSLLPTPADIALLWSLLRSRSTSRIRPILSAPPRMTTISGTPTGITASRGWRPRSVLDLLFMLVPTTAALGVAFGSVTVAGVALYPFKVLALVLCGVVLATHRRAPSAATPVLAASACLAAWALMSTLWSPASAGGFQEATIFVFLVALSFSPPDPSGRAGSPRS